MMAKNGSGEETGVVTALVRGLDILRCFDRPGLQLTVSQIARLAALTQPTTWRLCQTLLDRGFLIRSPESTALRVGVPVLTLGFAAIKGLSVPVFAAPYLQQLTDEFGCSTTLSMRQGIEVISIDSRHGDFLEPNHPVGWRAALTSTASGLAVLTVLPEQDRLATLAQLEARNRDAWPRRQARIKAANDQYEAENTVVFDGMYASHYTAVAVPLIEGQSPDAAFWAISCGGLSTRWTPDRLQTVAAALRKTKDILQPALAMLAK